LANETFDAKALFLKYYIDTKSKNTAKSYKIGLQRFEKWYGKTANDILEERRADLESKDFMRIRRFNDLLEKFGKDMQQKENLSINTTRTLSIGVIQFFAYFGVPIKVSFKSIITKKTYIPDIADFRRMFKIADLKGKVIISLGLDLAWRISDFIALKKSDIPDLSLECPIQIEKTTFKEKELSSTFISCETVDLLKEYMTTLREDNEYLFPTRCNGNHLDDEKINGVIQALAEKINMKIPNGKHFSFHAFRKRFLSTATNLGIDTEVKDLLVGKAVDQSHMTYYGDLKLRNAFTEIRVKALALISTSQVNVEQTQLTKLKDALVYSQERITKVETTNDVLRKELEVLTKNFEDLKVFVHKLPILGQAVNNPNRKEEILKMLQAWQNEDEAEAEEYEEKKRDEVLGEQN
jgi:integrase